ncbi:LPXTG cell wall anchor domain-containing protein [Cryptosporangium aurantiacum]|uniref:LPXTG-motif cell wall anchor domain-containing protein n=1 Tax=Cryptosporangium aurantiacum TaxID=134849 RepID=A0A1M7HPR5_9ACTN|nr:LPXTG cell wall anchor domain-containing protein [Cryptosporangium aurantiacum]SHM30388.1 LPXTG-motif cell wall anchor domain-containing protein [Cryptosporangium aurantiacum]
MKPRFRRLAYAGAATVGAAVTAFVLAGGPTATADQCEDVSRAATALSAECVPAARAVGVALEGRPGARVIGATPNEASPPPEEAENQPVVPSGGPQVPETTAPPEEAENQPAVPTGGPQVPETTPPAEETSTQPVVPGASPTPSGTPSEGVGTQPAVPESTPPGVPETGQNQPQLPVTGGDEGPMIAALGGLTLAAGAGLVLAARRRRPD